MDDHPTPLAPSGQPESQQPRALILEHHDAASRRQALADLQAALSALSVRSLLAGRHRLVLRFSQQAPYDPSGPTDPALHIFGPAGGQVATTDNTTYRLDNGQEYPVSDPAAAAAAIRSSRLPESNG